MTLGKKLLIGGAAIGAALLLASRRRQATGSRPAARSPDSSDATGRVVATSIPPGISDVDPQPLTYLTEAVDPDATRAAHEAISEQRERLPVPGKNLP